MTRTVRSAAEAGPGTKDNTVEMTGFCPRRREFDQEWDQEAEAPIAELEFHEGETAASLAPKIRLLHAYQRRLEERIRRRNAIVERKLLDVRKLDALEKRMTDTELNVHAALRPFARYHTDSEHAALVTGLAAESDLRMAISELTELHRAGIRTFTEAEAYHTAKQRREARGRHLHLKHGNNHHRDHLHPIPASAKKEGAGEPGHHPTTTAPGGSGTITPPADDRASRYSARSGLNATTSLLKRVLSSDGAPREVQKLLGSAGGAEGGPAGDAAGRLGRGWTEVPPELLPGANLLTEAERELCTSIRVLPAQILAARNHIHRARARGKRAAKADLVGLAGMDAYKAGRVYERIVAQTVAR